MTQIIDLDFDSNLFGYRVGKIVVDKPGWDIPKFINASKKYRLVYIFSEQELAHNYWESVDKKVTLNAGLSTMRDLQCHTVEYDSKTHNYDQLRDLTLQSGIYSRFNIDPNFTNGEYEKLYDLWLARSIDGHSAFEIDVLPEQNLLAGFITIGETNKTTANIGLLAVSDTFRGKGFGKTLVQNAFNIAFKNGYKDLEVVTQMQNMPALSLYKKMGFEIKNITNIYHYWNL